MPEPASATPPSGEAGKSVTAFVIRMPAPRIRKVVPKQKVVHCRFMATRSNTGARKRESVQPPELAPDDLEVFLPLLVNRISERISRSFTKAIRSFDLSLNECRVLRTVSLFGEIRLRELSDLSGVDLSTLCRLVRRLEQKEILTITLRGPTGRADMVTFSDHGQAVLAELARLAKVHEESLIAGIDPAELRACKHTLRKIFDNVSDDWATR